MEPVPEAERMEEFRSSPQLALQARDAIPTCPDSDPTKKPPTIRRSTDPSPSSPNFSWTPPPLPYRPRTTSPLAGTHTRSRSAVSLTPAKSRTQSIPGAGGPPHILFPQPPSTAPFETPSRARVPRKPVDETFPTSPVRASVFDVERKGPERSSSPTAGVMSPSNLLTTYRRPASPFRSMPHATVITSPVSPLAPSPLSSSPSLKGQDALAPGYNPGSVFLSSSVPSTPTSARSRSPSISSLETIPDSPDAEEAAMEAERIAQLKAAADAADKGDPLETKGRISPDVPTRGRTLGFSSRDKRKRWSVCGAERRGDIDLETIWED